ncbi:hypothetical protein [Listeria booriae]|uniref:hypothetical protein n=1 Tax=Listeria booriae TaxID=1552123 RepID=UPI001627CCC0|nr:hypothetical protein [Listeria booriae]MBC2047430.1 hypothetical protein [Listeria booriae]
MEKEIKWSWDETWAVIRGIQVLLSIIITSYLASEDLPGLGLAIFYSISATFLPSLLFGNKNISKIVQKKLFKEINTAYYNYIGICTVFIANLTTLSLITYILNTVGVSDIEEQKNMATLAWLISPMVIASLLILLLVTTAIFAAFFALVIKYSLIFYLTLFMFAGMSLVLTIYTFSQSILLSLYCIASFLVTTALFSALYVSSGNLRQTKLGLSKIRSKLNKSRTKSN